MARYFFNCSGGQTYAGNGSRNYDRSGYVGGYSWIESNYGNRKALIMFPSSDIRTRLVGLRVTATYLDFYVKDVFYSEAIAVFGTHNYTAVPDVWSASRVRTNRIQRANTPVGQIRNFSLGTVIGTEFKDGVTTGLTVGPGPSTNENYFVEIAPNNDSREPVLIIDAEVENVAPNAPTLQEPPAGAVVNVANQGVSLRWTHNDPNGDPQGAFRVQRRRSNGSGGYITEWWDGSNFVATQTDLAPSLLVSNNLVIPSGKFANGITWEWSVATKDSTGLWGAYSSWRTLYASTPPVTTVVPFENNRARVARPTLRWVFGDADGQGQYGWAAQIVEPAVYENPSWNPENYLGQVWSASSDGTATAAQPNVDLRNHRTYRAYVKTASSPNPAGGLQWSPWSFTTFQIVVPPSAPNMVYPSNGSVADLGVGFTMEWRNNYYSNTGSQTAFAIRRQQDEGEYEWWNGTAWIVPAANETVPFLPGANTNYSFRMNEVPNAHTYIFSVAIRDDYNEVSPYSSGVSVLASSAAQVNVLAPTGTTGVTNPTVTWTTYDVENDPQQSWQVRIIHSSVYNAGGVFDPKTATAVWDSEERFEESTRNIELPLDLDNGQTYRAYVRVATSGIYSGWSYGEFEVSIIPPATPTAVTVVNDEEGAIDIVIQGRDSMLSEDASRCFAEWEGWENSAEDTSNSTVANAYNFGSSQSRYATQVTSKAAGTMAARTTQIWPVAPGFQYTAAVTLLASFGVAPVSVYVSIEFFNADGNVIAISSSDPRPGGVPLTDESAVRALITANAPEGATHAGVRVTYQAVPAAGHAHLFFDPVLRPTTGGEWSPGGTLANTFASVTETTENRALRYGLNVPIPTDTQKLIVRDEEARMGSDMYYSVVIRAVYSNAALVTPPMLLPPARWVSGWVWLSDPLRRNSGRFFAPQSFDAVTRPVRQGKFRPIGRPDAVMTTGVRGLREGSFTIVAHTREERTAFQDLSDESEILLLRIPPDQGDPEGDTLYVRFEGDAPEERPLQHRTPHRTIKQSWTEQRPPTVNFEYAPLEEDG